jgi:hypothetical protein
LSPHDSDVRYQLVLQWSSASVAGGYDTLVEVEDLLIAKLRDQTKVDGHDIGSGEMNIFILTNDPKACFENVRATLQSHEMLASIRVAYREVSGNKYVILWPKDLTEFEVA